MLVIFGKLLAYVFIGAGIKFIDQAFDEKIWSQRLAVFLSLPVAIVFGILLFFDIPFSTVLLGSILFAVILTKKIDNVAFKLGMYITLMFFAFALVYLLIHSFSWMIFLVLVLLIFAGLLDEKINDYYDTRITFSILDKFLHTRPLLRITLLLLAFFGLVPFIYFIYLFLFDISYYFVDVYSRYLKIKRMAYARLPM